MESYHYPPEVFELLVEVIPRLFRSKRDVLLFFQGAGVHGRYLHDLHDTVAHDKESITKFEIVRRVLERINAVGDPALRERREVLKRVVEFEEFSTCWDNDRLQAQGLVAQLQRTVNVKDSFTRMSSEREQERGKRQKEHEAKIAALQKRSEERATIKKDLFALFAETNRQKRGKALEGVLNRLFKAEGILIREAFTINGDHGEGIVEQIDGAIEIDGQLYLVEMKWWHKPLGVEEISPHLNRLFLRSEARGIIISNSGYTEPAVTTCKQVLQQKVITLCTLEEFVRLFEGEENVKDLLKAKVHAAITEKNPLHVKERQTG